MTKLYRILGKRGRITIPFEIRQRVGFSYNDVLSFIESLSAEQQRVALVHLSVKWAEKKAGEQNAGA